MADKMGIVNKPPYFDDFDASKNYSKILFRPGRAVQSRELTQIQSVIQNQIAAIGNKLVNSPILSGGDFKIANVKYLKFSTAEDPSYLKNKLAIFGDTNTKSTIKILDVKQNTDSFLNNWVIFFEYRDGNELPSTLSLNPLPFQDQTFLATVIDEENLDQTTFSFVLKGVDDYSSLPASDKNESTGLAIYGNALLVKLGAGFFYKNGYVVATEDLTLSLSVLTQSGGSGKYLNYAPSLQNTKIGLKLVSKYITTEDDPTLYDPSAGFYNFAAPGADRLQLFPTLVQITDDMTDDIIELVDFVDGSSRALEPSIVKQQIGDCGGDRILKPFILDIIGNTLNINSGRAVVNCTDIEIVENQAVSLVKGSDNKRLFNQAFNDQCLSDALIVQSNSESSLFGGEGGSFANDYSVVNTNYFGSGKIKKLFSDEATRLEIVNCDGIKIGCLTLLDMEKNDDTSYRLYYNELQSYVTTIPISSLFAEACTLSLDGEKIFTIESSVPLTCADTTPGGKKRLVYKVPRGSNIKSVFDADYMITRDFVGDITTATIPGSNNGSPITATVAEFNMDIPNGVFNDNNTTANPSLFTVAINGKTIPIKASSVLTPHIRINDSRTKVTVVLSSADATPKAADGETPITVPTAGKCYMVTKVRFPEKSSATPSGAVSANPIPHRKKRLREARGSFIQNLSIEGNKTINLGFSDVYSLQSVVNAAGVDITEQFLFDNGQRNDRYDHASITLLPGIVTDNSDREYVVTFRYFEHEPIAPGFYGPITVNSYGFDANGNAISGFHGLDLNGNQITLGYDEIPNFLDRISGEVISLADAVDFRMIRTEEGLIENGVNKSSVLRARWFPSPESSAALESSYKLDLPRIDLLVLREDGSFVLLEGEPSNTPVPPEYPKDGCVVAEINVPGTVVSSEDFIIRKPPIKAITLPELNDMQNRLAELEKAVSIQLLENKARVQSAALNNEYLTGMVVDDFGGHYIGDVSNDEYNCSMDFSKGTLRAPFTTKFIDFVPSSGYPTTVSTEVNYFITAPTNTSGVTLVENGQGTTVKTVNSFASSDWHGYLSLDRPYNLWVDQTTKPVVRNNSRGENDAWDAGGEASQPNGRNKGFGTQWGFWKSLWFGERLINSVSFEKDRASAKNFSDNITNAAPSRFSRSINTDSLFAPTVKTIGNGGFGLTDRKSSRYVDSSLSFFSPENYVIVRGSSLKPKTTFSVFFENMTTPILQSRILNLDGTPMTSLESSSSGTVEFLLYIPNGTYITGNKVIKVVENTTSSKKSYASCIYSNNGGSWKDLAEGDENTVELELCPVGRTDILLKNEKTLYIDDVTINGVYQRVFVDKEEHPSGLILDRIGVYFCDIDTSIPVSVEIRKIVGDSLDYHHIIRHSRVEIVPSATGYSDFVFTKPVYLSSGEYAIILRSNSSLYKVHVSQRGLIRVDEAALGVNEDLFAFGVFGANGFFSGSSLVAKEDPSTTLRFYMKRKSFVVDSTVKKQINARLPLINGTDSITEFDLLHLANDNWRSTTGEVVYSIKSTDEEQTISSNTDIEGSDLFNTKSSILFASVSTSREDVSPIVDIRKLGLLLIKNRISKTIDIINNETKNFAGSNGSLMKYITRRTDLKLPANVLRSTIEAVIPSQFDVKMYAKILYEVDSDFDNQPYVEMKKMIGSNSISKESFKEMTFELDVSSNPNNFVSFSVKIVVSSTTTDQSTDSVDFYPELRNLAVVSALR